MSNGLGAAGCVAYAKPFVHTARTLRRSAFISSMVEPLRTARRVCQSSVRPLRTTGNRACAHAASLCGERTMCHGVSIAVSVSLGSRIVRSAGMTPGGVATGTRLGSNCVKLRSESRVNGIDVIAAGTRNARRVRPARSPFTSPGPVAGAMPVFHTFS